jgi:hypothetical protein
MDEEYIRKEPFSICDISLSSDEDLNIYTTDTFGSKDSDTDNTDHLNIDTDFCASHSSNSIGGFYSADLSDSDNFDEEETESSLHTAAYPPLMEKGHDSIHSEPFSVKRKAQFVKLSSGLKVGPTNKILSDLVGKKNEQERRKKGLNGKITEPFQESVLSAKTMSSGTAVSSTKKRYVSTGISPRNRDEDVCNNEKVDEGKKKLKVTSSNILFSPRNEGIRFDDCSHRCLLRPSAFKAVTPTASHTQESVSIHPEHSEWGVFSYRLSTLKSLAKRRSYVPMDGHQNGKKPGKYKFEPQDEGRIPKKAVRDKLRFDLLRTDYTLSQDRSFIGSKDMRNVDKSSVQSSKKNHKWNADFSVFTENLESSFRSSSDKKSNFLLSTATDIPDSPNKIARRHEIKSKRLPKEDKTNEISMPAQAINEATGDLTQTQKLTYVNKKRLEGKDCSVTYDPLLATSFNRKVSILGSIENIKQLNYPASDGDDDFAFKNNNVMHGFAFEDIENIKSMNAEEIRKNKDIVFPRSADFVFEGVENTKFMNGEEIKENEDILFPSTSADIVFEGVENTKFMNGEEMKENEDIIFPRNLSFQFHIMVADKEMASTKVRIGDTDYTSAYSSRGNASLHRNTKASKVFTNKSTRPSYRPICDESKDENEVEFPPTLQNQIDRSKIAKVKETLTIFNRKTLPNNQFQLGPSICAHMVPKIHSIGSTCHKPEMNIEIPVNVIETNSHLSLVYEQAKSHRTADATSCADHDIISVPAISHESGKSTCSNVQESPSDTATVPSQLCDTLYNTPKKDVSTAFRKYAEAISGSSDHSESVPLSDHSESVPLSELSKLHHEATDTEDLCYGPSDNPDEMKPTEDYVNSSKPIVSLQPNNVEKKARNSIYPFNREKLGRTKNSVCPISTHHEKVNVGSKVCEKDDEYADRKLEVESLSSHQEGPTSPSNIIKGLEENLRSQLALQKGRRQLVQRRTLKKVDFHRVRQDLTNLEYKRAKIVKLLKQARTEAQTQT